MVSKKFNIIQKWIVTNAFCYFSSKFNRFFLTPDGSVHPSFCLYRHFLGNVSLVFSRFWHGARNPYEVVCQSQIFWKKFFCPQNWENEPKMGQKLFLNLLKNLVVNFYWVCFLMRIYIICCVPAQISYWGKVLSLRHGPKCSQPIRSQDFLINHISSANQ